MAEIGQRAAAKQRLLSVRATSSYATRRRGVAEERRLAAQSLPLGSQRMEFAIVLSVVQMVAILAGGIFAGVQLRSLSRQRERESALQLLHSFQTREFMTGLELILNCREGMSKREIEEFAGDKIVSVTVLLGTFESLGILAFRREIGMDLVDDFFSGPSCSRGRR
jgi:hypothetical protein